MHAKNFITPMAPASNRSLNPPNVGVSPAKLQNLKQLQKPPMMMIQPPQYQQQPPPPQQQPYLSPENSQQLHSPRLLAHPHPHPLPFPSPMQMMPPPQQQQQQQTIDQLIRFLRESQEKLEQSQEECKREIADKRRLIQKNAELGGQLEESRKGLHEMQMLLKSVKETTDNISRKRDQRDKELTIVINENKELKLNIRRLESNNIELQSRIYEIDHTLKSTSINKEDETKRYHDEINKLKNLLKEKDETISNVQDEMRNVQDSYIKIKTECLRVRGDKSILVAEIESLKQQLSSAQESNKVITNEIMKLRIDKTNQFTEYQNELDKIRGVTASLVNNDARLAEMDALRKAMETRMQLMEAHMRSSGSYNMMMGAMHQAQQLSLQQAPPPFVKTMPVGNNGNATPTMMKRVIVSNGNGNATVGGIIGAKTVAKKIVAKRVVKGGGGGGGDSGSEKDSSEPPSPSASTKSNKSIKSTKSTATTATATAPAPAPVPPSSPSTTKSPLRTAIGGNNGNNSEEGIKNLKAAFLQAKAASSSAIINSDDANGAGSSKKLLDQLQLELSIGKDNTIINQHFNAFKQAVLVELTDLKTRKTKLSEVLDAWTAQFASSNNGRQPTKDETDAAMKKTVDDIKDVLSAISKRETKLKKVETEVGLKLSEGGNKFSLPKVDE